MEYNGFCVRIDARDGYKDKINGTFSLTQDYQAVLAVKHKGSKGDNPHYHVVVKTQVKDQAFRVRMKKVFDQGKGNAHMSIKPWDGNIDAISYMFHELADDEESSEAIVYRKNISDETIGKARDRNREVQEKMAQAKQRSSLTIEAELLEIYRKSKRNPHPWEIARDIVLHALRNDKYVPNDFLLKAMANKIAFKLFDGDIEKQETFAASLVMGAFRMDDDARQVFHAMLNPEPVFQRVKEDWPDRRDAMMRGGRGV